MPTNRILSFQMRAQSAVECLNVGLDVHLCRSDCAFACTKHSYIYVGLSGGWRLCDLAASYVVVVVVFGRKCFATFATATTRRALIIDRMRSACVDFEKCHRKHNEFDIIKMHVCEYVVCVILSTNIEHISDAHRSQHSRALRRYMSVLL